MHCEIRSMEENSTTKRDTLPPRGRVREARKEWIVHADGALANRLQEDEIKQHLLGNRSRNHQIREDFPRAKDEQEREAEEAARVYQAMILQQEQKDAEVAANLALMIEKEEKDRKKVLECEDEELAKLLQQKEKHRVDRKEKDRRELESHTPKKDKHTERFGRNLPQPYVGENINRPILNTQVNRNQMTPNNNSSGYVDDINSLGLPPQDLLIAPMRLCNLNETVRAIPCRSSPSPPPMSEEEARRLQEEKDAELARLLQEEESQDELSKLNRDRLLAIETQDKELARLLQEKERAKARKAREKAKQKAALKRLQEEGDGLVKTADVVQTASCSSQQPPVRPTELNLKNKCKPRYPDPEEIVELSENSKLSNIAMAIDPTYTRQSQRSHHRVESKQIPEPDEISPCVSLPDPDLVEELNAPPYMPIQGQRRFPEKKIKSKESCRQQ